MNLVYKKLEYIKVLSYSFKLITSYSTNIIFIFLIFSLPRLISLGVHTSLFASCSNDGTTRIWDCNRTERQYPTNR